MIKMAIANRRRTTSATAMPMIAPWGRPLWGVDVDVGL
jgi:hypothetical protein